MSNAPSARTFGSTTHLPLGEGLVRDLECQVRQAQSQWHSPAVSAGMVRDGALVWSTHVGSARLDPNTAPTDDTQYMIGSITKTFTAVLVMSLRDAGRLSLDDRLEKYLPQTRHGALTIRQMLSHASGLQREPVGRIWESLDAPDQERLVRELEDAEQVLPVHFAFHYSNLAFALLGQIVEQLEGRPWSDVVTERVLAPLEMKNTGLEPDDSGRALGYQVDPHTGVATVEPQFDLRATAPLGGLLEHSCRHGSLCRIHRGPDRRSPVLRHPGRDVSAADHDRRRGLGPGLRAGL